ncbi:MAG: hypothetical protein M0D53_09260 [Flavobacterium sp. JAD_PAG50586_2]|nr:MAG: hypothetical protein M0D53_09260 [Flavobacterium sp. JAD_PAG50586_2]
MKKLFYVAVILAFMCSCASHPGRVCGGPGGGRCVDNSTIQKQIHNQPLV